MGFTSQDLSDVEAAIVKLGKGERIQRVTGSDGRTLVYSESTLADLRNLRAEIMNDVASAAGSRRRFILTTTDKGL